MKRKKAKEILAESFRELAANKSFDKITVKNITDNCGYSPATFYRQFKDKYDLIAWEYAVRTEQILERVGTDRFDFSQILLDTAYRYRDEKNYLANLLLHTSGHDSFIHYMTEINYRELLRCIKTVTDADKLDRRTEMYIRLYCMGTVSLSCEWILGKYEVSPEEMAEIYENALPGPLMMLLQK